MKKILGIVAGIVGIISVILGVGKGRENQPFFKRSKMCNKLY